MTRPDNLGSARGPARAFILVVLGRYGRLVAGLVASAAVVVGCQAPFPYLSKYVIDTILPQSDFERLGVVAMLALVLGLGAAGSGFWLSMYKARFCLRLKRDIALEITANWLAVPLREQEQAEPGDIMEVVGEGERGPSRAVELIATFLLSLMQLVVMSVLAMREYFALATIAMAFIPVEIAATQRAGRHLSHLSLAAAKSYGKARQGLYSALKNIFTIRACDSGGIVIGSAHERYTAYVQDQLLTVRVRERVKLIAGSIDGVAMALMAYLGWGRVIAGELTIGGFVAFMAYIRLLRSPALTLVGVLAQVKELAGRYERYAALLSRGDAVGSTAVSSRSLLGGVVELENVGFSFKRRGAVFADVNLMIPLDGITVVTGSNGTGKSTLLKLVAGYYEPTLGDLRHFSRGGSMVTAADAVSQFAWVECADGLLDMPLLQYATLGTPYRDLASAEAELKRLGVAWLMEGLVERGREVDRNNREQVSAGELVRLKIVRAILLARPIIVIDEGLAHLDLVSRNQIVLAMSNLRSTATFLIVDHSGLASKVADRTIVVGREGCDVLMYEGCLAKS